MKPLKADLKMVKQKNLTTCESEQTEQRTAVATSAELLDPAVQQLKHKCKQDRWPSVTAVIRRRYHTVFVSLCFCHG